MSTPRPDNIPATASWDPEDKVFRAGPVDADGNKHGTWQAWYPSGRLYGEEPFAAGVLHGAAWSARGEGDESPFDATFDARVARLETVHDRGMLMTERCFTASGELVGSNGEPWPERSGDIPETATYVARSEVWVDGPIDAAAPITGRQRLWYREGQLLTDIEFRDGAKHGTSRVYGHGALTVETDVKGPPLTRLAEATYADGVLQRVAFFERDWNGGDTAMLPHPLASAELVGGALHGKLTWHVERHISFDQPVMTIGDREVTVSELFADRRLRGCVQLEAEYAGGALVSRRWFGKEGHELFPPTPVSDFGPVTTPDQIAGYLVRGDFERDLARWFVGREVSNLDDDAGRAPDVFAQLPDAQRAAALVLDTLLKTAKVPFLETVGMYAYGFDPIKNELYGVEDPRYFGLAYDRSGNMQLLDLQTGEVVGYEHEEGRFDERRAFADLDRWAFAMLRVQLVAERRSDKAAVQALFEQLGLRGGVFELGFSG